MKSALLLLSGTALAALSFLSVTYAASSFIEDREPTVFLQSGEPLWKSEPTYLDRGNMTLSEVEARFGRNPTNPAGVEVAEAGGEIQLSTHIVAAQNPSHTDWCMARYRSYQPEDNTYQPYGGGRRRCESPYGGGSVVIEAVEAPEAVTYQAEGQQSAELDASTWCRMQYRSYR